MRDPVKRGLTLTLPMGAAVILGNLFTALRPGPTTVASPFTPHPSSLPLVPQPLWLPKVPSGLQCSCAPGPWITEEWLNGFAKCVWYGMYKIHFGVSWLMVMIKGISIVGSHPQMAAQRRHTDG